MNRRFKVIVTLCALVTVSACAAAPRQRTLPTERIEEGPNSTTAVRRQFEGNWSLLSFKVNAEDGRQADVDATGTLTFDAFGVLDVRYKMSDEGLKRLASVGVTSPNPVISTTGRVVIDTQPASNYLHRRRLRGARAWIRSETGRADCRLDSVF